VVEMINLNKIQEEKPIEELINFSIINVDKPTEHTSFDVVARIRGIFNTKKVGHFGTLDPKVTGVLPICLNKACKLSEFFMHHDKEYIGKMYVHKEISGTKLEQEMKKFIGKIKQKPPVKSSVKRVERERTVNKFKIKEIEGKTVGFHCDVEAGTYIRKLIHDLGKNIGGAHMIKLIRVRAGIFDIKHAYPIEEIKKAYTLWKEKGDESELRKMLIPAEIITKIYPSVQVKEELVYSLLNGKPLIKEDLDEKLPDSDIFVVFNNDKFIGMYGKVEQEKIIAKPKMVFS
jgi:H/ACA ribonucleoprotein complex subunit 4